MLLVKSSKKRQVHIKPSFWTSFLKRALQQPAAMIVNQIVGELLKGILIKLAAADRADNNFLGYNRGGR